MAEQVEIAPTPAAEPSMVCACGNKTWTTHKGLRIHLSVKQQMATGRRYRTALEASQMVCGCCGKKWTRRRDLEQHLLTKKITGEARKKHKTRSDKRTITCEFCEHTFPDTGELNRHQNGIGV